MVGHSADPGVACSAWDHSECAGTEHCPPRCPRFVDAAGTPLLIEPYDPAYGDALTRLYEDLDAGSKTLGLPPESTERIERWLDRLVSDGWNLVARAGRTVVGHVAASPADDDVPRIVAFVRREYQGRGIGTELLKQLIAHADDRDHEALALDVAPGNRRAIRVYDNLGFEVTERLGAEVAMRLSLERPIARRVRLPPAERDGRSGGDP